MKKIFIGILIIWLLGISVSAQDDQPKLIDEFGKINSEELEARLDGYLVQLGNINGARLQVLMNRGEKDTFGAPHRFLAKMRSYLIFRGFSADKIITTNCAAKESKWTQLWILSNKDEQKNCSPDNFAPDKTALFDTVYYSNPQADGCCIVESGFDNAEADASLSALARELKRAPESKAYIYIYRGTNVYSVFLDDTKARLIRKLDSFALAEKMRKNALKILARNGVDASRLIIKQSGFRDSTRNMELWFVPKGGAIPQPKPDYFPKTKRNT